MKKPVLRQMPTSITAGSAQSGDRMPFPIGSPTSDSHAARVPTCGSSRNAQAIDTMLIDATKGKKRTLRKKPRAGILPFSSIANTNASAMEIGAVTIAYSTVFPRSFQKRLSAISFDQLSRPIHWAGPMMRASVKERRSESMIGQPTNTARTTRAGARKA